MAVYETNVCQTLIWISCFLQISAATPLPASIRLVGGMSRNEGRIEIYYNGDWGTICDDDWTIQNGHVACRELGYTEALRYELGATAFGEGVGSIWLDGVMCEGNEPSLAECANRGWGVHNCQHSEDIGVVCSTNKVTTSVPIRPNDLRLVGGPSTREGRLEIYHYGQWGAICDDEWSIENANVACRRMGFVGALELDLTAGQYGQGVGPIFLDNVVCTGTESSLDECAHSGWGVHDCSHNEDIVIACSDREIRLVGGSTALEGRVEVLYNGIWGSICDDGWDLNEAMVVCRELGYDKAVGAPTSAYYGQSEGPILLDQVACNGVELTLTSCDSQEWGVHNCQHTEDAGVICQQLEETTNSALEDVDVRLVGGSSLFEGRVEVLYDGLWGTVCDDKWTIEDGQVVCRQLGFGSALSVEGDAAFGPGNGPVLLDELQCVGTESSLALCKSAGWTNHDCGHAEDAAVVCDFPAGRPATSLHSIRLTGGDTPNEGRVEIYHDGKWGSICDDGWDQNEANVVCLQLGYEGAIRVETEPVYGDSTGEVWLDDVICDGSETGLADCSHNGWGVHDCTHREDAGVVCIPGTQTSSPSKTIRLMDGSTPEEGRVEIYISGRWGTICAHAWDLMDAGVACHQLGFGNAMRADGGASFGQGSIDIVLDNVRCVGNEATLQNCPRDVASSTSCDHGQDAGVVCSKFAPSSNVRLIGGFTSNEGRVEIFHDGVWGTICDSDWDDIDAKVICRQLGYADVMSAKRNAFYGQGNGPMLMANLECTGDETDIIRCLHPGWYEVPSYCSHSRDAGVTCQVATSDGYLNVRLANANNVYNTHEGRLEVYHHGYWGTVCGRSFDLNAASVVCRQLGFQGAIAARNFAFYGEGTGSILLSDVDCRGYEAGLGDCSHSEDNTAGCTHADDAGLLCIQTGNTLSFTSLEIIITGAILVVILLMALALAVICCRCRRGRAKDHHSHDLHSEDEEERRAIQMGRLRGRRSSTPNEYASASSVRRSRRCSTGNTCSPYESVFPQATGGALFHDEYEPMDFKIRGGFPPQPPPYTSPLASPVCTVDTPEYPPPPSPATRPRTLPFKLIPPVHEIDEEAIADIGAEPCIYQEVDDYLIPEAASPASISCLYDLPSPSLEEDQEK